MVRAGNLAGVVADVLRQAPLSPEKVALAWRLAVGPTVDRVTTVDLTPGGVLLVRAETPAWAAAIRTSTTLIHRRLDQSLGLGTVARIDVI